MSYRRTLGADETVGSPIVLERLDKIDASAAEILRRQQAQERRDRIATIVTIAGALFAAVRLGIVTVPKLFRRGASKVGELGEAALSPAARNPGRRRRRR